MLEAGRAGRATSSSGSARLDGRPVGVVANQPPVAGRRARCRCRKEGRALRADLQRFSLPLVVLVDTPGFMPGSKQERLGVIRHGAKLVHAFAEGNVPKVTVILRKAFGGAYIAMNSRDLGADSYSPGRRRNSG